MKQIKTTTVVAAAILTLMSSAAFAGDKSIPDFNVPSPAAHRMPIGANDPVRNADKPVAKDRSNSEAALNDQTSSPKGNGSESAVAAVNETYVEWKVGRGHTLSRLAKAFSTPVRDIAKVNNITDANKLRAGEIIRIPISADWSYIVQRGDSVSTIARSFGIPISAIVGANTSITDANHIAVGMPLVIPVVLSSDSGEATARN